MDKVQLAELIEHLRSARSDVQTVLQWPRVYEVLPPHRLQMLRFSQHWYDDALRDLAQVKPGD